MHPIPSTTPPARSPTTTTLVPAQRTSTGSTWHMGSRTSSWTSQQLRPRWAKSSQARATQQALGQRDVPAWRWRPRSAPRRQKPRRTQEPRKGGRSGRAWRRLAPEMTGACLSLFWIRWRALEEILIRARRKTHKSQVRPLHRGRHAKRGRVVAGGWWARAGMAAVSSHAVATYRQILFESCASTCCGSAATSCASPSLAHSNMPNMPPSREIERGHPL